MSILLHIIIQGSVRGPDGIGECQGTWWHRGVSGDRDGVGECQGTWWHRGVSGDRDGVGECQGT